MVLAKLKRKFKTTPEKKEGAHFSKSEAKFVIEKKKNGIGLKSSLMEYAALERGLKVNRLSKRIITVESKTGKTFGFVHMNGNSSSRVGNMLCDRKHDSRLLLKNAGISVVDSEVFKYSEFEKALNYAKKLGYPVVVKPTVLSRGRGITTNINTDDEFKEAWEKGYNAYKKKSKTRQLLVERHIEGNDYRFFVVEDQVIYVTYRKRANVIGDGKSTVLELIKRKNEERKKNPYLMNYLIPEDINELDMLLKENITLDYVPSKGEELILRSQSNLSAGGDSIDLTDNVHPGFKEIAVKSAQAIPGVEYVGVDFITKDITAKPTKSNYIVSEVEYSPAPISHFPFVGKRRDMAGAILEHYLRKEI